MTKAEIMNALNRCEPYVVPACCCGCPYDGCWGTKEECVTQLHSDAYVLLKAQEPQVMTLEELVAWQKLPFVERDPIYVEYRKGKGFGAPHWAQDNFGYNVATCQDNYKSGVYGLLIRCWTSRPTDEQREATPWND